MNGLIPDFLRGGLARPSAALERRPSLNARGLRGGWRGRPHTDEAVFAVRQLVETTPLTYSDIAEKTGVGRASICRWTQDGGWVRPAGAAVATDRACSQRASIHLQARTLHRRAQAIAERILNDLECDPSVGPEELFTALAMLKAAKLARMPKKRVPRRDRAAEAAGPPLPAMRADPRRPPGRPRKDDLPSPHLPSVLAQHRETMRGRRTPRRERAHLAMPTPDPQG